MPKVEVTDSHGDTTTLAARQAVVIATGSAAAIPPIRGLAEPLDGFTATTCANLARRYRTALAVPLMLPKLRPRRCAGRTFQKCAISG